MTIQTQPGARVSRRNFLALAGAAAASSTLAAPAIAQNKPPLELMKLPYDEAALAPVISGNTVGFHYGKHHRGYVDTVNRLVQNDPLGQLPLDELIKTTSINPNRAAIFNAAAQIWNHDFYWNCLKPGGGGAPTGAIKAKIDEDLGGFDKFKTDFAAISNGQFGSGWGWLVVENGKLALTRTPNAETPMVRGATCLLTIDVWEHAYYLDYQNRRADYTAALIDKLLNWDFANAQLATAKKG